MHDGDHLVDQRPRRRLRLRLRLRLGKLADLGFLHPFLGRHLGVHDSDHLVDQRPRRRLRHRLRLRLHRHGCGRGFWVRLGKLADLGFLHPLLGRHLGVHDLDHLVHEGRGQDLARLEHLRAVLQGVCAIGRDGRALLRHHHRLGLGLGFGLRLFHGWPVKSLGCDPPHLFHHDLFEQVVRRPLHRLLDQRVQLPRHLPLGLVGAEVDVDVVAAVLAHVAVAEDNVPAPDPHGHAVVARGGRNPLDPRQQLCVTRGLELVHRLPDAKLVDEAEIALVVFRLLLAKELRCQVRHRRRRLHAVERGAKAGPAVGAVTAVAAVTAVPLPLQPPLACCTVRPVQRVRRVRVGVGPVMLGSAPWRRPVVRARRRTCCPLRTRAAAPPALCRTAPGPTAAHPAAAAAAAA